MRSVHRLPAHCGVVVIGAHEVEWIIVDQRSIPLGFFFLIALTKLTSISSVSHHCYLLKTVRTTVYTPGPTMSATPTTILQGARGYAQSRKQQPLGRTRLSARASRSRTMVQRRDLRPRRALSQGISELMTSSRVEISPHCRSCETLSTCFG